MALRYFFIFIPKFKSLDINIFCNNNIFKYVRYNLTYLLIRSINENKVNRIIWLYHGRSFEITLGIIGVVAAMTLPAIINETRNKELEVQFKKVYSELNQIAQLFKNEKGISLSE